MKLRTIPALFLCSLALCLPAPAQESRPAPPKKSTPEKTAPKRNTDLDADSRSLELLDRAQSLSYVVPMKTASFRGELLLSSRMQQAPKSASFFYLWENAGGTLTYANPADEAQAARLGFRADLLAVLFRKTPWPDQLKGCTLRAGDEGGKPTIHIDGENVQGLKKMVFGKNGLPTLLEIQPPQSPNPGTIELVYEKLGDKFSPRSFVTKFEIPNMGTLVSRMDYEFTQASGHHVWSKFSSSMQMGDRRVGGVEAKFSDYKFGEALRPSPAEPKAPKRPTTRKAG